MSNALSQGVIDIYSSKIYNVHFLIIDLHPPTGSEFLVRSREKHRSQAYNKESLSLKPQISCSAK